MATAPGSPAGTARTTTGTATRSATLRETSFGTARAWTSASRAAARSVSTSRCAAVSSACSLAASRRADDSSCAISGSQPTVEALADSQPAVVFADARGEKLVHVRVGVLHQDEQLQMGVVDLVVPDGDHARVPGDLGSVKAI